MVLKDSFAITDNVRHFVCRMQNDSVLKYIAGQFITIMIPAEPKVKRRSYSIASMINQTGEIEFAASYVEQGIGSEYLFNLSPGDLVTVTGPFGRLILTEDMKPENLVLMSTGTGVTPYRSMLPLLPSLNYPIHILQGVQYRTDALYVDDFLTYAKRYEHIHYHLYYSRDKLADHAAHEHTGYVQQAIPKLELDSAQDIVYLCGNPHMIDDTFKQLTDCGFTSSQIRREKYISHK